MKTTALLLSFLSFSILANAQKDSTKEKTTNITIGPIKIKVDNEEEEIEAFVDSITHKKKEKEDRLKLGVNYGISGLYSNSKGKNLLDIDGISNPVDLSKSRVFGINLTYNFPISNRVDWGIGLGTDFNTYKFDQNVNVVENKGLARADTASNRSSYKLRVSNLNIPVFFSFKSKNQNVKFVLGGYVSYKYNSCLNEKYAQNNSNYELKITNNFGINELNYGVLSRITYKNFGFFATYGMDNLFKNKNQLYPYTAGLTLGGF